jgi:hypothetical protein
MNFKDAVRASLRISDSLVQQYIDDITPEEMFVQPVPDANHIAWQIGHLIVSERNLVEAAVPGSMPPLPEGFAELHRRNSMPSAHPGDYLSKKEYLELAKHVRTATLAALDSMGDSDFDKPITARVPGFVRNAGDCFLTIGLHWSLHAGQWVVTRRKLGRARMF